MTTMLDLLYSRHSIRKYTAQSIESEKIEKLIEAALLSPSSCNREAWKFAVVTDKDALKQLSVSKPGAAMLSHAQLAIVVCGNPQESDVWVEDCSIAA
ncbi:MAG: nitroreductase family protein, partial [Bacteroidota bacterium]|nr:nitroreductase family protein [Bacteroidota bacterium]